jgi:hypothetical protein
MNWSIVGWVVIGISTILLGTLTLMAHDQWGNCLRNLTPIGSLKNTRTDAIEGGLTRSIVLGHRLNSLAYPGLGLSSLTALPSLLDPESLAAGNMNVSTSSGSLMVFARQIIENRYQDGFSKALTPEKVNAALLGPTVFSFTASLLCALSIQSGQGLTLLGNYGPESSLWSEACLSKNGQVFASAGTIASQSTLFLHVEYLLIGEEIYLLSGSFNSDNGKIAALLTEDILRILLILALTAGAILKAMGIL